MNNIIQNIITEQLKLLHRASEHTEENIAQLVELTKAIALLIRSVPDDLL